MKAPGREGTGGRVPTDDPRRPRTDERRDALRRLYERHQATVLAYLLRRAQPEEAEDLVAETFLVAWRRLDDLPAHEAGWLCGIARNLLLNERRARRRRDDLVRRAGSLAHPSPETPEEIVLARDPDVAEALARLSASDREALTLAVWDGLSGAEAAAALGCTRAVYNVRLLRARRRFGKLVRALSAGSGAPVDLSSLEVGNGR